MAVDQRSVPPWARRPEVRIGAVVVVAAVIGLIVWLVAIRDTGSKSVNGATAASPERLRALGVEVGHPVYWAGPAANTTYELTRTPSGRIYVRYLPDGIPIGIPNPSFTLVGTYPVAGGYRLLQERAKQAGQKSFAAPRGGFALYAKTRPTNVLLAYPNQNLQIEVYDPSPRVARSLITSGRVAPVP
jgi:hypothetical protein